MCQEIDIINTDDEQPRDTLTTQDIEIVDAPVTAPVDTATNALMSRMSHYVPLNPNAKNADKKQFNTVVALAKEKKSADL